MSFVLFAPIAVIFTIIYKKVNLPTYAQYKMPPIQC